MSLPLDDQLVHLHWTDAALLAKLVREVDQCKRWREDSPDINAKFTGIADDIARQIQEILAPSERPVRLDGP